MKKLILTVFAVAGLSAGTAFADADSQAGSAWNNHPALGPELAPDYNPHAARQVARDSWYRGEAYESNPYYQQRSRPAYPYGAPVARASRADRDGDGVINRQDRFPNDPSRW